ncbi:hypothetical protein AMTR_s00002p00011710 [Amborella trichopoda]|uniref:Uncharacterized protein n=1 Tax=Amborella trichopoda TaxID=13333 RepID=W1P1U5_AMBTC|nr:hypothetical protein AMTR_s00002p00011710 [Amborella trichopoda]
MISKTTPASKSHNRVPYDYPDPYQRVPYSLEVPCLPQTFNDDARYVDSLRMSMLSIHEKSPSHGPSTHDDPPDGLHVHGHVSSDI